MEIRVLTTKAIEGCKQSIENWKGQIRQEKSNIQNKKEAFIETGMRTAWFGRSRKRWETLWSYRGDSLMSPERWQSLGLKSLEEKLTNNQRFCSRLEGLRFTRLL